MVVREDRKASAPGHTRFKKIDLVVLLGLETNICWGNRANTFLIHSLQHRLQTPLDFSALNPTQLPVYLQIRQAQLPLEQLPFLQRIAKWYHKRDVLDM